MNFVKQIYCDEKTIFINWNRFPAQMFHNVDHIVIGAWRTSQVCS